VGKIEELSLILMISLVLLDLVAENEQNGINAFFQKLLTVGKALYFC
jgi:hypothetical protein